MTVMTVLMRGEEGMEVRHATRRDATWGREGDPTGKAGYWLGDDEGAALYLGRARSAAEAAFGEVEIFEAAELYLRREERLEHPEGEFDSASRWHPSMIEEQRCCGRIRAPSGAYPYSLLVHCRTARHVAELHGVDLREVRRAARILQGLETGVRLDVHRDAPGLARYALYRMAREGSRDDLLELEGEMRALRGLLSGAELRGMREAELRESAVRRLAPAAARARATA